MNRAKRFTQDFYSRVGPTLELKPWMSLEGSMAGVIHALAERTDAQSGVTAAVLFHNEFSKVLRSDDSIEVLNELYDGSDYERHYRHLQQAAAAGDDKAKPTIRDVQMNAVVTTTPRALQRVIKPEMVEGGLYPRFLWLRTHLRPEDLMPRPLHDHLGRAKALGVWEMWWRALELHRHQGGQREIVFDSAADDWLVETVWEGLRDVLTRDTYEAGVAMRVNAYATSLAAIYAGSRGNFYDGELHVELDDTVRAANLVIRCYSDALTLGGPLSTVGLDISDKAKLVLAAVERAGRTGCSRRDLYQALNRHATRGELAEIVDTLAEMELVVEVVSTVGAQGGRPGRRVYGAGYAPGVSQA